MAELDDDAGLRSGAANYLLRTAQQSNVQLSAMADQKASIVLGATFVMATLASSDLVTGDETPIALVVLAVTSVISGILAILALMPKVGSDTGPGTRNPLFFGHVARMSVEEYSEDMRGVLQDADSMHAAILEDIHQSSQVLLHSKFRWLRMSYMTLLVGVVVTFLSALIA